MWTGDDLQRLVSRELSDYRLIVVSNRQPYVFKMVDGVPRGEMPPGGLTAAIDPLMRACGGTWIAQSNGEDDLAAMDDSGRIPGAYRCACLLHAVAQLERRGEHGLLLRFRQRGPVAVVPHRLHRTRIRRRALWLLSISEPSFRRSGARRDQRRAGHSSHSGLSPCPAPQVHPRGQSRHYHRAILAHTLA